MPIGSRHPHVQQHTTGKTRDLPISDALADLLEAAALRANIDIVWIYSGGQCAAGTCSKRTGSTRHDLGGAADIHLVVSGRRLNFDDASDRKVFALFLETCAAYGAEGIGAATDYMGPTAAHVGFGGRAVWGRNGKSANAPVWLRSAVARGWSSRNRVLGAPSDQADEEKIFEELLQSLPDSPNAEVEPLPDDYDAS